MVGRSLLFIGLIFRTWSIFQKKKHRVCFLRTLSDIFCSHNIILSSTAINFFSPPTLISRAFCTSQFRNWEDLRRFPSLMNATIFRLIFPYPSLFTNLLYPQFVSQFRIIAFNFNLFSSFSVPCVICSLPSTFSDSSLLLLLTSEHCIAIYLYSPFVFCHFLTSSSKRLLN